MIRALLIALAASLFACLAQAATYAVTPATLAARVAASVDDVLVLAPGAYGDVSIRKGHVTLQGPREAVARSVTVLGPATTLDGFAVSLTPDASTISSTGAVRIVSAAGVTVKNLTVRCGVAVTGVPQTADTLTPRPGDNVLGLPTGRGITADRSDGLVLSGNDIAQCHRGVVISNTAGASVVGNHIHDLRNTFLDGGNDTGLTVANNLMETANPWKQGAKGDHADYVHIWTQPANQTGPTDGVTITGNVMLQGTGAGIMGVYLDDNGNGLGFTHATVARNVLYGAHAQGILLENTFGTVADNWLLMASGDPAHDAPGIRLDTLTRVEFHRNVAHDLAKTLAALPAGNDNTIVPPAVQPAWLVALARRSTAR